MTTTTAPAEISFIDYLPQATDAELARYTLRYRTRTDTLSRIHARAVKTEIARRAVRKS